MRRLYFAAHSTDNPGSSNSDIPEEIETMPALSPTERIEIISQIRKWGHHFDGVDPLSFLKKATGQLWPRRRPPPLGSTGIAKRGRPLMVSKPSRYMGNLGQFLRTFPRLLPAAGVPEAAEARDQRTLPKAWRIVSHLLQHAPHHDAPGWGILRTGTTEAGLREHGFETPALCPAHQITMNELLTGYPRSRRSTTADKIEPQRPPNQRSP